ncbi:MAG TPA: PaaI family thioesterase [Novosphingobium sp.]|nr:PaaI family thioesterase [Novosphingobium sp.]
MAMDEAALLAQGWKRLSGVRYTAALGPTFGRIVDGRPMVGLLALDHLGNDNLGIVHGGAMMTFADIALGYGLGHANDGRGNFVTTQMQVQFIAAAQVGEFITCAPEVIRKTGSMAFVRGLIVAGDRGVASADAIFKLLDPAKFAAIKAG